MGPTCPKCGNEMLPLQIMEFIEGLPQHQNCEDPFALPEGVVMELKPEPEPEEPSILGAVATLVTQKPPPTV